VTGVQRSAKDIDVIGRLQQSNRRRYALGVAGVALLVSLAGAMNPPATPPPRPAASNGRPVLTDAQTFAIVAERLRTGDSYYDAMGSELRRNGYPAREPFNWRTPLHLRALALAPWIVWRSVLTAMLVALYVAVMMTVRSQPANWVANVLTLGILVISAAPDAIFVSEAWAGGLIGLSACAYTLDRRPAAIGLALTALFVRELTAPYCVACALFAVWERRWREVAAWAAGAAAYAIYYGWHVTQVIAHRTPADIAHGESWLTFLGVPFLQATLLKLGWFALLPSSLTAVALVLLVTGLLAPETPRYLRTASALYAGFFLVAGFAFNDYWGFMAAPVWAITCGYGAGAMAVALKDLSASSSAPA
jgi:hypothetical protein